MGIPNGGDRAPAGVEPDNKYFWRKETHRKKVNGEVREYYTWVTRNQIDVGPVLPLIRSALRMHDGTNEAFFERIGIDDSKWSRWNSGEYNCANITTIDNVCLELGYSITAVYDEAE